MAAHDDHDRQGLHRRLHRHLGLRPGGRLGVRDREGTRSDGAVRRHPAALPRFVVGLLRAVPAAFSAWLSCGLIRLTGLKDATAEADLVRGLFFVMTFFSIGMASNFKRLWAEGIGRLALVYVISLFGFIIWIGLAISWLFFHGVHPPLITGGG